VTGRLQATVSGESAGEGAAGWTAGRLVRAPVLLRRPRVWRNFGGPSVTWQQLRRPFALTGTIKSAALVDVVPGAWWVEAAAAVRRHVRRAAREAIAPLDPQSAAIVTAILIGDRAGLSDDVERRLQAAGTYHVIAISGGNVALVAALCVVLVRLVVRGARASALATLVVVVAYGFVVEGDASVTRAVTAAVVYLAVGLAGLVPRPAAVIAVVAILVAIADPLVVLDVGAWLSFGATIGIVLGAGRLLGRLAPGRSPGRSTRSKFAAALAAVVAATAAAELALLPVAAGVFSRVGVAGLAVNLVAIPAMGVVQAAGAVTVALAGWWDGGSGVAAWVAHTAAVVLVDSARIVDVAPWLSWRVPPPPIGVIAVYYTGWAVWFMTRAPARARRAALACTAAAGVVVATAAAGAPFAPRPGHLRATMLDVGQGDAILVQFPQGQSMLVDTGGAGPRFDIAGRVVVPSAWALGVRRLDWLVITHADLDHIGGALGVVADLRPREIWDGVPVEASPERRALEDEARARRVPWRRVQAGDALTLDGVGVDVRHPPPPDWERPRVRNDDSIVLRLAYGDVEILLTGDAASEFESASDATAGSHRLRVLKVAHHGSRTSTAERFVDGYRPAVALISAGQGNLFGHPARDVVTRLARARADVYRTDRDGAVQIETDGHVLGITTVSGRRRGVAVWPWR
jgi:competence protein ComEC